MIYKFPLTAWQLMIMSLARRLSFPLEMDDAVVFGKSRGWKLMIADCEQFIMEQASKIITDDHHIVWDTRKWTVFETIPAKFPVLCEVLSGFCPSEMELVSSGKSLVAASAEAVEAARAQFEDDPEAQSRLAWEIRAFCEHILAVAPDIKGTPEDNFLHWCMLLRREVEYNTSGSRNTMSLPVSTMAPEAVLKASMDDRYPDPFRELAANLIGDISRPIGSCFLPASHQKALFQHNRETGIWSWHIVTEVSWESGVSPGCGFTLDIEGISNLVFAHMLGIWLEDVQQKGSE